VGEDAVVVFRLPEEVDQFQKTPDGHVPADPLPLGSDDDGHDAEACTTGGDHLMSVSE
jgi:hypothetical protein